VTAEKLSRWGVGVDAVRAFIADPLGGSERLAAVAGELDARGLGEFAEVDLTIVRGLAYYTGVVFEVFDRGAKERAIAGGGRYDTLLATMSDGKVDLPALGFGMGDVVLGNLIEETPAARARRDLWLAGQGGLDVFVVVAKDELRREALGLLQRLRDAGLRADAPLGPAKVGKQFQAAEQAGARHAALVGDEWPLVKLKHLATREERLVPAEEVARNCGAL
jgi:histidyl-tRNA synthetase